jgi:hypothetical protein
MKTALISFYLIICYLLSLIQAELIETVVTNCFLLHDDYKHLTPLAQVIIFDHVGRILWHCR